MKLYSLRITNWRSVLIGHTVINYWIISATSEEEATNMLNQYFVKKEDLTIKLLAEKSTLDESVIILAGFN